MKAIHAYEQGGRHRAAGMPCQDRTFYLEQDGAAAIALADGAGNERYTHSEYGAECVTRTIALFLCRNFDRICETEEEKLKKVIETVCQEKLRERAGELGLPDIQPLSSTLLAAAVKGDTLILCHVGDGLIGGVEKGVPVVLSGPENGEFASTTFFIASPGADRHVRVTVRPVGDLGCVFLMSDGTSDYTFDDVSGGFTRGVLSMAAMAYEEDGEQQLRRTIRKFMTEKDSRSDDCSFAVMTLKEDREGASLSLGMKVSEGTDSRTGSPESAPFDSEIDNKETETDGDELSGGRRTGKHSRRSSLRLRRMKVYLAAALIFLVCAAAGLKLGRTWTQSGGEEDPVPVEETETVEEVKAETETQPAEEAKPEAGTQPAEEVKPEAETQPAEEAKPEEGTQPAGEAKPEAETQPAEEAKPEAGTQPAGEAKPEAGTQPAEEVKPEAETQPAEEVKTEAGTEPAGETDTPQSEAGEIGMNIRETGGKIEDNVELSGKIKEKIRETQKKLQRLLGEGTYRIFHKVK